MKGPLEASVSRLDFAVKKEERAIELYKLPGVAETLDWTAALLRLGISTLEPLMAMSRSPSASGQM